MVVIRAVIDKRFIAKSAWSRPAAIRLAHERNALGDALRAELGRTGGDGSAAQPQHIDLATSPVLRESTAPPPRP